MNICKPQLTPHIMFSYIATQGVWYLKGLIVEKSKPFIVRMKYWA